MLLCLRALRKVRLISPLILSIMKRFSQRLSTFASLLGCVVLFLGCVSQKTSETARVTDEVVMSSHMFKKVYTLAPGDQIQIMVVRHPEVSRTAMIRPDGMIAIPLLGDVEVAGRSIDEMTTHLEGRFSKRLVDPEVYVLGVSLREPMIYVVGDAIAPRPIPLRSARTAAAAISQAGGFNYSGSRKTVSLIRIEQSGQISARTLEAESRDQSSIFIALSQVSLQADDILFIPENNRSQFKRFIDDFINKPLSGVNSVLSPWANYKLIDSTF